MLEMTFCQLHNRGNLIYHDNGYARVFGKQDKGIQNYTTFFQYSISMASEV